METPDTFSARVASRSYVCSRLSPKVAASVFASKPSSVASAPTNFQKASSPPTRPTASEASWHSVDVGCHGCVCV